MEYRHALFLPLELLADTYQQLATMNNAISLRMFGRAGIGSVDSKIRGKNGKREALRLAVEHRTEAFECLPNEFRHKHIYIKVLMLIAQMEVELGRNEIAKEHVRVAMELCRVRMGINDEHLFWRIFPLKTYRKLHKAVHQ